MGKIIAIANQKGVWERPQPPSIWAHVWPPTGRRCFSLMPTLQANATSGLGVVPEESQLSIYGCLVDGEPAATAVMPTCVEGLEIICSRIDLVGAEVELMNLRDRERALSKGA